MKQKYAIGFITFMLATVLAACVHDYPAMTPDGEEGIDPTYSMFLSKSFYEFNIFLTSVNLAL